MNRLARWMMRLYPARWRERYGDELDALISDAGADTRVVADLARGGIRMQFSTWSFPKLAVVLGLAGVVLGVAASFIIKPLNESKVTLAMQGTPQQLHELVEWAEPQLLCRSELSSIINDPRLLLYIHELKVTPLEEVIDLMKSNTRVAVGQGQTIEIFFRYPDAGKAQQTAAIFADHFLAISGNERTERSFGTRHPYLNVVDTASLPTSGPILRALERVGMLLGASIPFLWRRLRSKRIFSWWLFLFVPVCAILGALAGDSPVIFSGEQGNIPGYRYRSTAMMEAGGTTQKQIQDLIDGTLTHTSLSAIIQDPQLLLFSDELKKTPLEDVVQEMKRRVTIAPVPDHPNYITFAFEYNDRFKAQHAVDLMMSRMTDLSKRNGAGTAIVPLGNWGPVSIQSPASPPQPIAADSSQYAETGGIIGIILAGLIAAFRRRWTPESAITQ